MIDTTQEIRLLTLKQPYASLLFAGKTIETRSWDTKYRGMVLVSASKESYSWDAVHDISGSHNFERILQWAGNEGRGHEKLCGHAIGIATITAAGSMMFEDESEAMVRWQSDLYSWHLRNQRRIIPFPITGKVGLIPVHPDIKKLITISQTELKLQ